MYACDDESKQFLLMTSNICLKLEQFCNSAVAYPGSLFGGGGFATNSVEDIGEREQGSMGASLLVTGFGGSSNLVQEISFHIVTFS